jgi:signal transduction histidine kinase
MWIGWGPENSFLYNDAYLSVLGAAKHPWALGRPAAEVWAEIWDVCGPLADKVYKKGEATFVNDVRLFMRRGDDFLEETFYSFSYSPIRDEAGLVSGLFCPSSEATAKNLNARRLATLSELAGNTFVEKTAERASASAAATLAKNTDDIPFFLVYLLDETGAKAVLRESNRIQRGSIRAPETVNLTGEKLAGEVWPIPEAVRALELKEVSVRGLEFSFRGPANQPLTDAIVLPLISRGYDCPIGVLVAGVNPTRQLDAEYRTFFTLVAGQLATAIANARASEEERKRVEALAELDRAKTVFFNNVSHEFRTPLTLMLGPVEELLNKGASLSAEEKQHQIEVVHRNSLRLLKLVNTLLDFSRIEAGRIQASYEPVDLSALTTDLASAFRSAMEKAGLRFEVKCEPLPEPVFVDRDMWEKIVFNLLSNAFKFTLTGGVTVTVSREKEEAVLRVADTGTGIPGHELANVFRRFHRVQNAQARTHEGTGIGLALVQDLVKLHGGSISVESKTEAGTTFTVRIPFGDLHLPVEQLAGERQQALVSKLSGDVFVEEAMRWVPVGSGDRPAEGEPAAAADGSQLPRIVVADDNADMRDYIRHLLHGRYALEMTRDGGEALAAARQKKPDVIISDIMMPRMDGFALLNAIRQDEELKTVPVILLSARAGGEARVEGIEQGADDYLVKPFSGRELVARLEAQLKLARLREAATERQRQLNRELERKVEERTASLRQAIAQMEEFSYSVSHDLRSPVRAMQGYAQAIIEDYADRLDDEGRELLQRIVQNGSRMDRLIHDVLTYTRVSRQEVRLQPVSLDRLARDVIEQYPEFAAGRAKIVIEGKLPDVIGHEPSLSQVISNLLSNAVKFVGPGVKPEVRIRAERLAGRVQVWFEDNGIGIKPEYQSRLFGMFERIHPDGAYEGTGIGLAIVRKSMDRMGGKAGVESDGLHGSKFWIRLGAPP